jgi:hypothetical protein
MNGVSGRLERHVSLKRFGHRLAASGTSPGRWANIMTDWPMWISLVASVPTTREHGLKIR